MKQSLRHVVTPLVIRDHHEHAEGKLFVVFGMSTVPHGEAAATVVVLITVGPERERLVRLGAPIYFEIEKVFEGIAPVCAFIDPHKPVRAYEYLGGLVGPRPWRLRGFKLIEERPGGELYKLIVWERSYGRGKRCFHIEDGDLMAQGGIADLEAFLELLPGTARIFGKPRAR